MQEFNQIFSEESMELGRQMGFTAAKTALRAGPTARKLGDRGVA
jgi:hypothetical protein